MKKFSLLTFGVLALVYGCQSGGGEATPTNEPPKTETSSTTPPTGGDATASEPTFADVKGVLSACTGCHGGPKPKEGLALDTDEGIMSVVTPGSPENSKIMRAVRGSGMKQMPPGNPLAEDKIKTIEDWIKAGAKA